MGGIGMCDDVNCVIPTPIEDGTDCSTTTGSPGICEAGACIERLP